MGLHSPFGYVGYEITSIEFAIEILDKLCSRCHTDADYHLKCRGCPAGYLFYNCKEYILSAGEDDKRFELYASDEWVKRSGRKLSDGERQKDLKMAQDYKPECDTLRIMKRKLKQINPHPFYYIKGKDKYKRPKVLNDFAQLSVVYKEQRLSRLKDWDVLPLEPNIDEAK